MKGMEATDFGMPPSESRPPESIRLVKMGSVLWLAHGALMLFGLVGFFSFFFASGLQFLQGGSSLALVAVITLGGYIIAIVFALVGSVFLGLAVLRSIVPPQSPAAGYAYLAHAALAAGGAVGLGLLTVASWLATPDLLRTSLFVLFGSWLGTAVVLPAGVGLSRAALSHFRLRGLLAYAIVNAAGVVPFTLILLANLTFIPDLTQATLLGLLLAVGALLSFIVAPVLALVAFALLLAQSRRAWPQHGPA